MGWCKKYAIINLQRTNHITYGELWLSQELLVRLTLVVMHCEQNFIKNILKIVISENDIGKWGVICNVETWDNICG
jgi:hypothetical protein